jgi:hypothetical protein
MPLRPDEIDMQGSRDHDTGYLSFPRCSWRRSRACPRNLALELLKKLLNDEIGTVSRRNLVQSRSFAEMLDQSINKYHNRSLEAAQVIEVRQTSRRKRP